MTTQGCKYVSLSESRAGFVDRSHHVVGENGDDICVVVPLAHDQVELISAGLVEFVALVGQQ